MQIVRRDPEKGYLDNLFWIPKSKVNVDGAKAALTFQFFEERQSRYLFLWQETATHLLVPREFWDPSECEFPTIDCRPESYPYCEVRSKIVLDFKEPTKTTQRDALAALLACRGGVLQLGCVAGDTLLQLNRAGKGFQMTIEEAFRRMATDPSTPGPKWDPRIPTFIRSHVGKRIGLNQVETILAQGARQTFELVFENGRTLRVTSDHQVLTGRGYISLNEGLKVGDMVVADGGQTRWARREHSTAKAKPVYRRLAWYPSHPYAHKNGLRAGRQRWTLEEHRAVAEAKLNGLSLRDFRNRCRSGEVAGLQFVDPNEFHVHHEDHNHRDNSPDNLEVLPAATHLRHHQPGVEAFGYGIPTPMRLARIRPGAVEMVYDVVCAEPHHNFVANGVVVHNCGKGKTVIALELAVREHVPTLIIVDNSQLMEQWTEAIGLFLEVPGGVGLIQADVFDWKKQVVLATYTTLANHAETLPEEIRRWFGLIIWDEGHHMAAVTWARSADLFYGKRIALTATPERSDGYNVIYDFHVGKVVYKDLTQDLKPDFYFLWTGLKLNVQDPIVKAQVVDKNGELHIGKIASYFATWRVRLDKVIAEVRAATDEGRRIIVLSKSVDELINLLALWNGIEDLYTDVPWPSAEDVEETVAPRELTPKEQVKLAKSLGIARGRLKDANLNPAHRKLLEEQRDGIIRRFKEHQVFKKVLALREKRQRDYLNDLLKIPSNAGLMIRKVRPKERTAMLRSKQVMFAIAKYGREGLDEERLDTIIASMPVSDRNALQQLMGRIQRKKAGKKRCVCLFLEDDIGLLVAMCKNIRRHLRDWPAEDGGPYTYSYIGHPLSQKGVAQWQKQSLRVPGL